TPASMRSVFSRRPMASANHRTERGLARATGTPCLHRRTKANFSYPPVASMATRATPFSRQNVASASIPGVSLVKRRTSAPGRRTTSRLPEDTSTPQMSLVTVTCLVRASVAPATVRSCVTTAMVPKLTRGCGLRWGGRQSPREGAYGHRPPRSDAFTTSRRHLPDTRWGGTIARCARLSLHSPLHRIRPRADRDAPLRVRGEPPPHALLQRLDLGRRHCAKRRADARAEKSGRPELLEIGKAPLDGDL